MDLWVAAAHTGARIRCPGIEVKPELAVPCGDDGTLDRVLQLANVTGPVVARELGEIGFAERGAAPVLLDRAIEEGSRKQRNVLPTFAERRQQDREDVETVEQVLSKTPGLDLARELGEDEDARNRRLEEPRPYGSVAFVGEESFPARAIGNRDREDPVDPGVALQDPGDLEVVTKASAVGLEDRRHARPVTGVRRLIGHLETHEDHVPAAVLAHEVRSLADEGRPQNRSSVGKMREGLARFHRASENTAGTIRASVRPIRLSALYGLSALCRESI